MSGTIVVFGLWHLGCVTAACLASEGRHVVGLDLDGERVAALQAGKPPIAEPGLTELVQAGLASGRLEFTSSPAEALARAETLWITFDTPVNDEDEADVDWVHSQLQAVESFVQPGALVLVSSQVPVGFTRSLELAWRSRDPSLQFACSPENLRLGQALEAFRHPARAVVGLGPGVDKQRVSALFCPFTDHVEWMSLESAEMTKHALNGFLATSVAYTNELARICERVGADAREVERGLRTEARIGSRAYVSPGPPIAGGTLARDIAFLGHLASEHGLESPIMDAVRTSNRLHQGWAREHALRLTAEIEAPRVALLGLTYKPGTDTLRRSTSLELGKALAQRGVAVAAYDPAISELPADASCLSLERGVAPALAGADVAIVATGWPEFKELRADDFVRAMRRPRVIDQAGILPGLSDDPRVEYVAVGRPLAAGAAR